MKSLKDQGVPLGARILFRLQWLHYILLVTLIILSVPFLLPFWLVLLCNQDMFESIMALMNRQEAKIIAHREKLINLYRSHE